VRIGFIGLGNMGGPMSANLARAGHDVLGHDRSPEVLMRGTAKNVTIVTGIEDVAREAEVIVTMLPDGAAVRSAWLGAGGVIDTAEPGTLLIDCSTIDVETARLVALAAEAKGLHALDAPVSGGVAGAQGASLTFMVGGPAATLERARPVFEAMGSHVIHCGEAGSGQAAKLCNNLILGVSMIAVAEAFVLAERLGLSHEALFEVASRSSGQCWALTSYCPVPGPVPASPANHDYAPGFTAAMMLKDLKLAADAGAPGLGPEAARIYDRFVRAHDKGGRDSGGLDFSAIVTALRDET